MLIATFSGVRMIHDEQYRCRVRRYCAAYQRNIKTFVEAYRQQHKTETVNENLIIIGRDGRSVGELYYPIAIKVMTDAGFKVQDLGIVPTPTVQQLVKLQHAAGGIVITASHNPNEWCGLKFIGPSSIFLTPDECKVVYGDLREEEGYTDKELTDVNEELYQSLPEGILQHVDTVLASDIIPVERIR